MCHHRDTGGTRLIAKVVPKRSCYRHRFDYQRDKVHVHTDPAVRESIRRRHSEARPIRRANLEHRCDSPSHCPACGGSQIRSSRSKSCSKLVFDLKFTRNGVKRWIIKYYTERNLCLGCGKSFGGKCHGSPRKVDRLPCGYAERTFCRSPRPSSPRPASRSLSSSLESIPA